MNALFVALSLPPNVHVPAGALDTRSEDPTLLARSRHNASLVDQVKAVKQKAAVVEAELFEESSKNPGLATTRR